jgi:hypothetical protein
LDEKTLINISKFLINNLQIYSVFKFTSIYRYTNNSCNNYYQILIAL